jgi:hypothetical protein
MSIFYASDVECVITVLFRTELFEFLLFFILNIVYFCQD